MVQLPAIGYVKLRDIIGDRRRGISGVYPVSRSTWYAGVAAGRFPRPVKLACGRAVAWAVEDVHALIASARTEAL
jgi:prophage regulatory protein